MIRPIRGDDEDGVTRLHRSLSPETVYARYFYTFQLSERISHERLGRICHPAPGDETVLVVEKVAPPASDCQIIGVGRLSVSPGSDTGEVAFVVDDICQGQGIGSELLRRLLQIARGKKLRRLRARILPANLMMRRVCSNAGMRLTGALLEAEMAAEIDL